MVTYLYSYASGFMVFRSVSVLKHRNVFDEKKKRFRINASRYDSRLFIYGCRPLTVERRLAFDRDKNVYLMWFRTVYYIFVK